MKTIAYLGPENTYTHFAAQKRFGSRYQYRHAPTIEDVFYLVEREDVHYGVVPIENTIGGSVSHTLDRFVDFKHSPVMIHGEIETPIRHYLIYRPKAQLSQLAVVYSHPQPFTQCNRWLEKNLPNVERWETNSTAEAVQCLLGRKASRTHTKHRLQQRAAIGMQELAKANRLACIPIPQSRENKTRFLILGLGQMPRGEANKTSVMFALKDRPGALYDVLAPFKRHKINLTKIESHPSKERAWEYLFFINFEGHILDVKIQRVLKALERRTAIFRVLGSYPV